MERKFKELIDNIQVPEETVNKTESMLCEQLLFRNNSHRVIEDDEISEEQNNTVYHIAQKSRTIREKILLACCFGGLFLGVSTGALQLSRKNEPNHVPGTDGILVVTDTPTPTETPLIDRKEEREDSSTTSQDKNTQGHKKEENTTTNNKSNEKDKNTSNAQTPNTFNNEITVPDDGVLEENVEPTEEVFPTETTMPEEENSTTDGSNIEPSPIVSPEVTQNPTSETPAVETITPTPSFLPEATENPNQIEEVDMTLTNRFLSGSLYEVGNYAVLDTDNDGIVEKVTYSIPSNNTEEKSYSIRIGDSKIYGKASKLDGKLYAIALKRDTKYIFFIVPAEKKTSIYYYMQGKLVCLANFQTGLKKMSLKSDGRIISIESAKTMCDWEHKYFYKVKPIYKSSSKKLSCFQVSSLSKSSYSMDECATVMKKVTLYKDKKMKKKGITLRVGDTITLKKTDDKSWVLIENTETRKKGYMKLVANSRKCVINKKKVNISDVLDGLSYEE